MKECGTCGSSRVTASEHNPYIGVCHDCDTGVLLVDQVAVCDKSAEQKLAELKELINRPHNDDFFKGVEIEAAHQKERWSENDEGKSEQDWIFLFGWLSGKATQARKDGNHEKAKHHAITAAAAMYNWHASITH